MSTVTCCIELVRGSGPHYPYDDFGCLYRLFLPLDRNGCVDAEALRRDDRYRGTRLRAADGEARGRIVAGRRGRFILEYDELKFYPSTLYLGSAPMTPGSFMRIGEYGGQADAFRISSVRKISAAPAEPVSTDRPTSYPAGHDVLAFVRSARLKRRRTHGAAHRLCTSALGAGSQQ